MTSTATLAVTIANYRRRAESYRADAKRARDDGDSTHADALEQVAVDYDAAAEQLELRATNELEPIKPPRMTVGRALEMLLESRGRSGLKTGAVTIGRSARGIVTWELTATADPDELEHLPAALDAAIAAHDRLAELYPDTEGK